MNPPPVTRFVDSYAQLPPRFYSRVDPTPVARPGLIRFNAALALDIGFDVGDFGESDLAEIFSGNRVLPQSQPIAMAYAGHQFGQFVPQLGDGRAILLGEVQAASGRRRDIQLKGSGRTPYSRGGDGRAALGPVLREYLVSEAMHALGLPTTRALAAVTTGEDVFREGRVPGAILTRVADGHVRVGTFQYFAARADAPGLRQLADYVIERHYPRAASSSDPYLELLRSVVRRQAGLVAGWMGLGFIHGVMNTDNMAVSGETIDFGPCAFMDAYDPATVFSSIDRMGRYAYANQPVAAQWNLARFAETLLGLIDADAERAVERATDAVAEFSGAYERAWADGMRRKLGLFTEEEGDVVLIRELQGLMHRSGADFTLTFRRLCQAADDETTDGQATAGVLVTNDAEEDPARLDAAERDWLRLWRARLAREPQPGGARAASMRLANPCYIPRNDRIEAVIRAAADRGDFAPFDELSRVLARPYEERSEFSAYALPPLPEERVTETFCGT